MAKSTTTLHQSLYMIKDVEMKFVASDKDKTVINDPCRGPESELESATAGSD